MASTEKGFFSPGEAGLFSFFGNEPTSYEALLHRRKIAEALAAQKKGFPKNVGEGLTYLGESIGEAGLNYRLRQAELAQDKREGSFESGAPRSGTTYVPGGGAYSPNNSPPGGAAAPRAAVDTGATVAATDAEPGTTTVAYAPEAPRDPEPTVAAPTVVAPPASAPAPFFPSPRPSHPSSMIRNPVQPTGGGELPPPAAPPSHGVLAGGPVQAPAEGGMTGDTAALESGLQRLAAQRRGDVAGSELFNPQPSMPPGYSGVGSTPRVANTGAFERPTAVADAGFNDMDAAAPNVVADVPLPRGRPEQQVAQGPTFRTERNAEVGSRVGFDRAVSGVHPELQARLMAAYNDMPPEVRDSFVLNEGYRTRDYQQHLYDTRSGRGLVGAPGHSRHESGGAVDVDRGPALDWLQKNGRQYGLSGIKGDYPHIQMTKGGRQFYDPDNPVALNAPGGGNVAVARGGYNAIDAAAAPTQVAASPREAVTNSMTTLAALPTQADAPALARERDVLGGGGQGGAQPRTASLGRAGIQSDAVPLGMNPTGSNVDAGVAAAVQQRNAITNKILEQQDKVPVQEVPQTDPTQAGASTPPTTNSSLASSEATTSPSPNPQVAQAPGATATDAPGSVFGAGMDRARAAAGDAGKPTAIPAAPPGAPIPGAPPPDSAAYVKPPPFKSAIEPPGPEPKRTVLGPSDVQKYWGPLITDRTVSPSLQAKAKRIYDEEEKFRALNQQHLDNDYLNKRTQWDKDVESWKNKDEHDVKTLTGRMTLEKAQFDALHMAPYEARVKAAEAFLKEAEVRRDPITLEKAKTDLINAQRDAEQKKFQLSTLNPLEEKSKKLAIERVEQQVAAGEHTTLHGRIVKNVNGEWKDVTPLINPDNIEITESVGKALRYYERGQMAKSQMTKIDQLTSLKEQSQANVRIIGNYLTSDEYKSMRGAANDWLTAIARDDSGATIKDEELDRYYKIYFPVPGDGPRQVQEKADRRSAAERGQYDSLGNAKPIADRYRKEIEAMDATGQPEGRVRIDTKTGEQQEVVGGKWRARKAKP